MGRGGGLYNLVRQAVRVIREEYPDARITVGSTSYFGEKKSQDYLFSILQSDIMPSVDIISWHPMYGTSPEFNGDYYTGYPAIVQRIKDIAFAHGFKGTYEADELTWFTLDGSNWDGWSKRYSDTVAAKYTARGVVMHLGMDVTAGIGSALLFDSNWVLIPSMVNNLSTVLAGTKTGNYPVEISTAAGKVVSYTFSLSNGDRLVAFWVDGIAVEDNSGISATMTIPDLSDRSAVGLDVLHGFRQELVAEKADGDLVLHDLLIKDYPTIILLSNIGTP